MARKTTHRLKNGPIPDDHWENETKPNSEAKLKKRYGGLDDFDAETRRLKAEMNKRTLTRSK